ncbi:MAG TPA: ADOP family duplicated permease [Gemmatimonadaceae bacterium]|nr:ADOP family duplicated permease [Gemmatimonadaceae bacterium]
MSRLTGWLYTLRALVRRNAADHEMAEEIAFHIDRQARKHESHGLSREEARELAMQEFGGATRWREEARRARGSGLVDTIEQDARETARALRRDPAFALMAIVTLALALGANAAMFGIIDRLLLRGPEHVAAPQQLARIYVTRRTRGGQVATLGWQPYVLYTSARDHARAFSTVAAYVSDRLRVGSGTEARFIPATYASSDLFSLAQVHPALGRFYTAREDRPPAGAQVAVLGYRFWQGEFGGDSSIVGRIVTLSSRAYRVVGVAPQGFTGIERSPVDVWLPMSDWPLDHHVPSDWPTNWRGTQTSIVGRLAVPRQVAEAELTALVRHAYVGNDRSMRSARVSLRSISYNMTGVEPPELRVARLLAGVALVMLLVAAANVTNLTLARAVRRRREISVRVALGAGRWHVVRLMVLESVTIALLGGLLGLVLAHWGGALIRRTLLPNVAWSAMPVDGRVLLWTAMAAVLTGIIVGLIPALRVIRGDVSAALHGSRTSSGSGIDSHGPTRAALQVVQFALSLVLLFAAGLFVKSLYDIRHLDLGYDSDRVLAVDISFPPPDSSSEDAAARSAVAAHARYEDLRARFARLPGVASASIAFGSPLSGVDILRVRVPGRDSLPPGAGGIAIVTAAAPGYFETVGTRMLHGRTFSTDDAFGTEPVVIVNQTMAKALWPGDDAIGRCIMLGRLHGGPCTRVVGVAQDVHHVALKEDALNQVYVPWGQDRHFIAGSVLLVRSNDDDATALVPELTGLLRHAAPDMQSVEIKTFEQLLDPQVRPWRVGATLFTLFGAIVVVVAAIGLFSVVSYLVTQRTHELGVRIALGARRAHVLRLIMGSGLRTAIVGAVVGGAAAIAIGPLVQPLLFDNRARDPWMLAAVATGLLVVAAAASLWPSWRATRVDPLISLRAE